MFLEEMGYPPMEELPSLPAVVSVVAAEQRRPPKRVVTDSNERLRHYDKDTFIVAADIDAELTRKMMDYMSRLPVEISKKIYKTEGTITGRFSYGTPVHSEQPRRTRMVMSLNDQMRLPIPASSAGGPAPETPRASDAAIQRIVSR